MSDVYDDEDEEHECPGADECDYAYCDERETFLVEVTRTVTYSVQAHSEDEATEVANDFDAFTVNEPHDARIESFEDGGDDVSVISEIEHYRKAAEFATQLAEIERAEQEEAVQA
jgi:hypothetical protein